MYNCKCTVLSNILVNLADENQPRCAEDPHLLRSSRVPGGRFREMLVLRFLISNSRRLLLRNNKTHTKQCNHVYPCRADASFLLCFLPHLLNPIRVTGTAFCEKLVLPVSDKYRDRISMGSPSLGGIKEAPPAAIATSDCGTHTSRTTQVLPSTAVHGPQLRWWCLCMGRTQMQCPRLSGCCLALPLETPAQAHLHL